MRCAQGDVVIGSYIKVSKPKGKDTVVIVKCYENHANVSGI